MNRLPVLAAARRRPLVAATVALIGAVVLVLASAAGQAAHAVVYLAAVAVSCVVVDLLAPRAAIDAPPVRRPAAESIVAAACTALGAAALTWNFVAKPAPGPARLALVAMVLLFTFPVALAATLLFRFRYGPRELGLRLRGLASAPAVVAVFAAAALLGAPENVLWGRMWKELGPWDFVAMELVDGLLGAALAEEFFRFVLQTRLGALVRDPAVGWLAASIVWALLHVPKAAGESHDAAAAFAGAVMIVPLGLLWGYMTHRAGSFVPAMLVHAVNLWGLQNF